MRRFAGWAERSVPTLHDALLMVGTLRFAHPTGFSQRRANALRPHGEEARSAVSNHVALLVRQPGFHPSRRRFAAPQDEVWHV
jgi:hypothetical protein